jgi:WD40 repeat protein
MLVLDLVGVRSVMFLHDTSLTLLQLLPDELALRVLGCLDWLDLLLCSAVCRRWRALALDPLLWKALCDVQGWAWRPPRLSRQQPRMLTPPPDVSEDEGMGDEELSPTGSSHDPVRGRHRHPRGGSFDASASATPHLRDRRRAHSAAPALASAVPAPAPDYKLLHQTHVRLRARVLRGACRLRVLQDRTDDAGADGAGGAHTGAIYCAQLHALAGGPQVLFTGAKDRTVREWDLAAGRVRRVFAGAHANSVLGLCAHGARLASAGSDRVVALWDLADGTLLQRRADHIDSVLCVRMDARRLVSCSKGRSASRSGPPILTLRTDRTIRTYSMPDMEAEHRLVGHRAAVNAVSLSGKHIVSASGDRSVRLWDADTGELLHALENQHSRGYACQYLIHLFARLTSASIAAVDATLPFVLTGSSDKHLRLIDLTTGRGWSTAPDGDETRGPQPPAPPSARVPSAPRHAPPSLLATLTTCGACGADWLPQPVPARERRRAPTVAAHADLVRSVALGRELCVSTSYDLTVKVWDRASGALVADLAGGHTGRVFAVAFDASKVRPSFHDRVIDCMLISSRRL